VIGTLSDTVIVTTEHPVLCKTPGMLIITFTLLPSKVGVSKWPKEKGAEERSHPQQFREQGPGTPNPDKIFTASCSTASPAGLPGS